MSFILCKHMQFTQLSFNSYNRLFFQFVFKFSRKLKICSCYTTLVSGREEKLKRGGGGGKGTPQKRTEIRINTAQNNIRKPETALKLPKLSKYRKPQLKTKMSQNRTKNRAKQPHQRNPLRPPFYGVQIDILNSASRILQCLSYYVKINSARHQHDTERTQNRAGL